MKLTPDIAAKLAEEVNKDSAYLVNAHMAEVLKALEEQKRDGGESKIKQQDECEPRYVATDDTLFSVADKSAAGKTTIRIRKGAAK